LLVDLRPNNEEYLKIQQTVEEVRSIITDGKVFLRFALASVIEAIRRNPGKYNNLLFNYTSASSTSTSTLAQGSILSHVEGYRDMILDETKRLEKLLKHFTNSIIDNTVGASSSSTFNLDPYNQSDIME
jgi:hypothetical protein